jgi:hypothetical protein
MNGLVLSLFPGIDLLGHGFELEGFCVVRGPDVIYVDLNEDGLAVAGDDEGGRVGGEAVGGKGVNRWFKDL